MASTTARATITATSGAALTAALLIATTSGGMLGAAAAILAMFTAAVTAGLVVFIIIEHASPSPWRLRSGTQSVDPARCSSCGRPRELQRGVRICLVCDVSVIS